MKDSLWEGMRWDMFGQCSWHQNILIMPRFLIPASVAHVDQVHDGQWKVAELDWLKIR